MDQYTFNMMLWDGIVSLDRWVTKRRWKGFDKGQLATHINTLQSWAPKTALSKRIKNRYLRIARCPLDVKGAWLIGLRPLVNYKGLGIFLQAYCELYCSTHKQRYLNKAKKCAQLLINGITINSEKGLWGWGHPFDYQSKIFFPRFTPYAIIATQVGFGMLALYKITHEQRYFTLCEEICEHFLTDYQMDRNVCQDGLCFSYSPIDTYHIHNANLSIGEFFSCVGTATGKTKYLEIAKQCANYAIHEMDADGFLSYWGNDQETTDYEDIYHAGYEARHLLNIGINCSYESAKQAGILRYEHMIKTFVENGVPWMRLPKDRVDMHGCAEAIICSVEMLNYSPKARGVIESCIAWASKNAKATDGSYYYLLRYNGDQLQRVDKIPLMRWVEAWMLLALSKAYRAQNQ